MLEGFFGHTTEKIQGNNPTFLEFSKRVATEAFHFIVPVVTSEQITASVSARRTRVELASTYTYTTEDHDNDKQLITGNVGDVPTTPRA